MTTSTIAGALLVESLTTLEHVGCQFWACEGPTLQPIDMVTCRVCELIARLRDALGRPHHLTDSRHPGRDYSAPPEEDNMSFDSYPPPYFPAAYPCGCLRTSTGAHRGDGSSSGPCPDFETVYPANGTTRLEDLTWKRRDAR